MRCLEESAWVGSLLPDVEIALQMTLKTKNMTQTHEQIRVTYRGRSHHDPGLEHDQDIGPLVASRTLGGASLPCLLKSGQHIITRATFFPINS